MKIRKNYCVSYPYQIHRSVKTGKSSRKNDRNAINGCGGSSRLAMRLRDHLIITSDYPFWYCCSGFRFNERKIVMTKHING